MTQLRMLAEDARTQRFGDNPSAPGGRTWEARCSRKRIANLRRQAYLLALELAQEKARLAYLEGAT